MERAEFAAQLKRLAPEIDRALLRWALPETDPVENLHDGVRYATGLDVEDERLRGKRLRPALAVLACDALGGSPDHAMPFAVAVELMHNFFLTHDDIEDGDEMRHGRPAVWRRYGLAHGINLGDYLHARVLAVVLRSREVGVSDETVLRLLALLSDTLEHTVRGQALDINARTSDGVSIENYMETVCEKTGYYLAAPMLGGAIIARADEAVFDSIRAFGAAVGPMYQIMDDLIDLTENKGRGERGADIREGKHSYMVAWSVSHLDAAARAELLEILGRPRRETTPAAVARAIEIFESCGAIGAAHDAIAELGRRAREATDCMPDRLRVLLRAAADYLESRKR